jgi:hypothetical protein
MEHVHRVQGEVGQMAQGLRQSEEPLGQGAQNQQSLKVLQGLQNNETDSNRLKRRIFLSGCFLNNFQQFHQYSEFFFG